LGDFVKLGNLAGEIVPERWTRVPPHDMGAAMWTRIEFKTLPRRRGRVLLAQAA